MKKVFVAFMLIFSVFWVFADEKDDDEKACEYSRNTKNAKVWQTYLEKFPNGTCSFEASAEIAKSENSASDSIASAEHTQQQAASQQNQQIRTYRPYVGWGVPLIIIGAGALANMAWTSAVAKYYVDNGSYYVRGGYGYNAYEYHEGNDKACAGYTTAAVMSGVLGAGLLITGAILTSIKRPVDQNFTLNNLSVTSTKGGMFASAGFAF